jgi:hypothetical protein
MVRRLGFLFVVLGALAVVSAASAAYPTPFAVRGLTALPNLDGSLHFVAKKLGSGTRIEAMDAKNAVVMSRTVPGAFGVARITQEGLTGGLFADGSAFVLQSVGLKSTSRFMIVGAKDLVPRSTISLKGTFGFDALSADGSKLYLIQHTSTQDIQHYIVRAYDLKARKLLPGRIADKSQQGWVMQGFAVDRVTSPDGRWVYTLYSNPGAYPFVHALDTARGIAHCIGVPWRGGESEPWNMRLALQLDGKSLAVNQGSGAGFIAIDTSTWKISYAKGSS